MRDSELRNTVKNAVAKRCSILGYEFNSDFRVDVPESNLITLYDNWEEIRQEIGKGQGGELKPYKGSKPKFCSIYSSTCMCVNNFALMKSFQNKASYLGMIDCRILRFEERMNTGISHPNLDVYLENNEGIIGIESKYTEILTSKLPNWKNEKSIGNLSNYLKRQTEIMDIPEGFAKNVIEYYAEITEKYYLDVSQLIKHTLGLIHRKQKLGKRDVQLCYMYWLPNNAKIYPQFQKHREEIEEFRGVIEPYIKFTDYSYSIFWELLEHDNEYAKQIQHLRSRYAIDV